MRRLLQIGPQEGDGMVAQGEADMAIILHHLASGGHRAKCCGGFRDFGDRLASATGRRREERQFLVAQSLDGPQGVAAREAEGRAKAIGLGDLGQRRDRHAGAAPEIVDGAEGPIGAGGDEGGAMGIGEALGHPQPKADREARRRRSAPACNPSGRH